MLVSISPPPPIIQAVLFAHEPARHWGFIMCGKFYIICEKRFGSQGNESSAAPVKLWIGSDAQRSRHMILIGEHTNSFCLE